MSKLMDLSPIIRTDKMRLGKIDSILRIFYENPEKKFTVREISKLTRIPRASAHNYLKMLRKKNLITKENNAENSILFRVKKINYYIEKIVESGLLDELVKVLNPSCIILFGSIRKGDSVMDSDIDLFIESDIKKELDLKNFEKKLGHKIQLFIESDIKKVHENLFNNIINGIKLYGSVTIK
ncbi:MAG: nucleotidyltransferase domain-containing protein [Nanoarchaeota archaeon]